MIYAGIVAGGTGARMKSALPKQFMEISGKPVIIHTLECFKDKVDAVVIACHTDYAEHMKMLAEKYVNLPTQVISGGADRMESVANIVRHLLNNGAADGDIILTHDGVRPFVSGRIIDESIENARKGHFCTVAVNSTDTVCLSSDGEMIDNVLNRKEVFNIQTPQTAQIKKLAELLANCPERSKYTDLGGLALAMGEKVKIIKGDAENIKITVPADICFAEALLKGDKPL